MEFTDYLVIKAVVLLVLAFGWGIYCGINGLDLSGRHPSEGPSEEADQQQERPADRR
jgi:hypothetical protein